MTSQPDLDRRGLLTKGFIWGSAGLTVAATGLVAAQPVAASEDAYGEGHGRGNRKRFSYDVACFGQTLRLTFHPDADPAAGDLRGSTFNVEGGIYPAGTISGTGFDPDAHARRQIGHWFCRGWFINDPDRPNPHVSTVQEYVVGTIRENRNFPTNTLTSSGTEGSDFERQVPIRAVVGGTGRWIGASGQVLQHLNGTNATILAGIGDNAPNFRFDFQLV